MDDYIKYRGKCKEFSIKLIEEDPSLRLVRGYYFCPYWGKQEHWWCKKEDGTIVDATKDQFPSKGNGSYEEYIGIIECSECGVSMKEEEASFDGRFAFCSYKCHGRFVGVF